MILGYFYFIYLFFILFVVLDEELEDLGNVFVWFWIIFILFFWVGEVVRKFCYFFIILFFEFNFLGFFLFVKSLEVSLFRVCGLKYCDGDICLKGVILYVGGY